jgi:acetylornithine deacetylase/succinyl-diaminopimelate desuccinylase-like protein
MGKLSPDDLAHKDDSGAPLGNCMRAVGVDIERVRNGEPLLDAKRVGAWLELHIEQAPVLIVRKLPIGIVTGVRGNVRHRNIECVGAAGHSGAVPRWLRHDAVFATAEDRGVEFKRDRRLHAAPALMDPGWIKHLKEAARGLGLPDEEIPSGAGHDAAVFANAGVPSAMIFIRNEHGSHNPHEAMAIDDFLAGVAVMRAALKEAANQ